MLIISLEVTNGDILSFLLLLVDIPFYNMISLVNFCVPKEQRIQAK